MVRIKGIILLLFVTCQACYSNLVRGNFPDYDHGIDLPTTRPLNIAHRGSSGALPEHTVEAYTHAVLNGADVIECDVCVTKDLKLVCLHESWFSGTTNVADIFPEERMNTYFVIDQGRQITDYFTVDFTLEELQQVGVKQRYSYRDHNYDEMFRISSLEEYIEVAQNAGRPVGIYPETKDPRWVNSLDIVTEAGTTFEDLLLDVLESYGYISNTDPCFVQSFNEDSIRYMSTKSDLPMIKLGTSSGVSDEVLEELSEWCYGIGPSRGQIVQTNFQGQISGHTDLVDRAHSFGLRVHPYTFRNENAHLAWDYEQDPYKEYMEFLEMRVDGYFNDFPATLSRFLNATYAD